MLSPKKAWEQNSLKKFAEASLKKPGMYLIALRTHLNCGKAMIGTMIESVTEALPKPANLQNPDEV
ncbi:MAG TPA: hypothetical protein VGR78_07735 [Verrucomicrobiae bacterium]|jgi:hypothetical protein|nr:hypothetical protein [Verrucomicrobiae bacterium]